MTSPSLYHVITGGGNPPALHGNVTFCFSFTVTEEEGSAIKCGNSEKKKINSTISVNVEGHS